MSLRRVAGRLVLTVLALVAGSMAVAQAPRPTLISNVTVIDGTGAPPLPGASVLVAGGRIALISPGPIPPPAGALVIDGSGRFLIPGLIDSHIHLQGGRGAAPGDGAVDRQLALRTLQGYLYSGVTSVFDSGNNAEFIFRLREEERAGGIIAPRIFATGSNVTSPGGYADSPFTIAVGEFTPEERARLAAHFDRRPDVQKLIYDHLGQLGRPLAPVFSEETFSRIVRSANSAGISTTVHAQTEAEAWAAIDAGVGAFAHPVRSAVTDGFVRTLAARRIPVATTLAVFSHIAMIEGSVDFLETPLFEAVVEPSQLEFQKVTERRRYATSGMSAQFRLMLPFMRSTILEMHRAGVVLALGTDRTWGPSVHMELALLHEAGIPLPDLLRIATLNAATYLHREHDLGSIERGKLADLVMLSADPTRDVAAYAAIDMVMKGGTIIDRSALDLPINRSRPE